MSGSTRGKKGKQRNNSKKNANQNQSSMYEGTYGNSRLANTMLSLMGKKCVTKVRNGAVYEGLFHAYSKQMDLSLNIVHRVETEAKNGSDHQLNSYPKEDDLVNEIIFKFDNLVSAKFEDVDLDFAVQDINETNGETNNLPRGVKGTEKKLEPWNGGGDSGDADPLTLGGLENSGIDGTNGWDADDMFKANEEKYGVKSDYDSSLSKYTMPLKIEDENAESVSRANRLAQEIEGGSEYRQRIDLELDDGTTEEDKFSAVTRDNNSRREHRSSRDYHDRDHDHHFTIREKERGDRDRDQGAPPYRNRDYGDRNRGRGSRMRDYPPRNPPGGYPGNAGHSRSMGPSGPPGSDRRNQMSMQPSDGPGSQNKFRNMQPPHLPPRFTRTGSGGHSRDDDRSKQNENAGMHPSYQQAKGQRHSRNQGRMPGARPWSNSPSADYMHGPPQMPHADSPVMMPQNGSGPSLSRTSSSSSNTSAPIPSGHRKHASTSSQDDQPMMHAPHHMRQTSQQSSSSSGSPVMQNVQGQRPQPMPVPGPQVQYQKRASVVPKILKRGAEESVVAKQKGDSNNPKSTVDNEGLFEKDCTAEDQDLNHEIVVVENRPEDNYSDEIRSREDRRDSGREFAARGLVPVVNHGQFRFTVGNGQYLRRNPYQYRPVVRSHRHFHRAQQPVNLRYVIVQHPIDADGRVRNSTDPATATWAAIARGNPKPVAMPPPADMSRHMAQQPPQGIPQASQGSNPIQVRSDHTYTWAPNLNYAAVNVQQTPMGNARPMHHGGASMQMQMPPRVHGQMAGVVQQQQTILPRQKIPSQGAVGPPKNQTPPQQAVHATSTSEQVELHAPKPEDGKHGRKMTESPSAQTAASTSNTKKQLQEFHRNFKLPSEIGKDTAALHGSSKSMPRQPGPPQQPAGQPNAQQQTYPAQAGGILQQPHPDHPSQGAVPPGVQVNPGQNHGTQQVKGPVSHHTQQIPGASPSIHDFATPSHLHSQMPGPSGVPGQITSDKSNMAAMRKPKGENSYASPNIHVAVSQVPQTKAYAVISVSAPNVHPIVSHHQSTMAGSGNNSAQRNQRHSPAVDSQGSSPPAAPSIEPNAQSETAESGGAQISLNPEAREFKPRAPGKTAVTTQPTTQVQQAPYVPHGQMLSPMHQLVPPTMYHAGSIIDTQGMIYQHTPGVMFPAQPYHHLPQMVSTMPSQQQMQQFAAFENPQQVYQGPGPQPMLHSNARVAMPPHMQQYAAEQGQHQVYQVPVPPQQAYMPSQARPHSAHTPNQGAHATATSPASQPVQQQPSHAVNVNHPAPPPMVQPPPGAQPQMFFVSQSHHPHLGQTPVPAQYITAPMQTSASMANVVPQQKGQHPPVSYVPQQYAKYQPPNS